ncbi:MAG: serine hydrolase domain-containing protein [Burkholderiaceae bacterium]
MSSFNPQGLHKAMRAQVDRHFLPGVSTALFHGQDVVDTFCYGQADIEAGRALHEDDLFRVFSNTKLISSVAVLILWERGCFELDTPVEEFLPALGQRQVLRAGATRINDTEPAASPITIRHLLTHTSGLSYGLFDPGSIMYQAYQDAVVRHPGKNLAEQLEALAGLPLGFHPGTAWEYSVATDVLGRLIEVLSGQSFGEFLKQEIFEPLAMTDTDFYVPSDKAQRLTTLYMSATPFTPSLPGLVRADDKPYPGAFLTKVPNESGGGGLVMSLGDMVKIVQSLLPGGQSRLKPETIQAMNTNQLPEGMCVAFPNLPRLTWRGFGLGSSVAISRGPLDPAGIEGCVTWGGLAGTHWWYHPTLNVGGVLMTQRFFGQADSHVVAFLNESFGALSALANNRAP